MPPLDTKPPPGDTNSSPTKGYPQCPSLLGILPGKRMLSSTSCSITDLVGPELTAFASGEKLKLRQMSSKGSVSVCHTALSQLPLHEGETGLFLAAQVARASQHRGSRACPGLFLPWDSQSVELVPYQSRIYHSRGDGEVVPFPQAAADTQHILPSQVLGVQQQLIPRHGGRKGILLSWTLVLAAPKEHQFWFWLLNPSAETLTFLHPAQPFLSSSNTRSSSILPALPGAAGLAPAQPGEEAAAPAGNPCPQPYPRAHIQELWELPGCSPRFTPAPAWAHTATALRARALVTPSHQGCPDWHREPPWCFPPAQVSGGRYSPRGLGHAPSCGRSGRPGARGRGDLRGVCATHGVCVPPTGCVWHPRGRCGTPGAVSQPPSLRAPI